MARFLLHAGADPNETPEQYARLPLAVDMGLYCILRLLLERGADPTYVPPWSDKPLDNAVYKNYYRCAKLLLDAGALAVCETDDLTGMLYPLIVMDDDMAIAIAEKMATSGTPASWLPSTLSRSLSKASSKASKITRNSSPSKQLRNAELEETGFLRADLRNDTKPGLLGALTTELEKIGGGFGILPKNLQEDLADQRSIAAWNFGESPEFEKSQLPDIRTVRKIYNLASRCFKNNHLESSWNNDVHSPILNSVLRDSPRADDIVDY
ncbi:hypothetical protein BDV11DRAFT_73561 [Aspergillus similis]